MLKPLCIYFQLAHSWTSSCRTTLSCISTVQSSFLFYLRKFLFKSLQYNPLWKLSKPPKINIVLYIWSFHGPKLSKTFYSSSPSSRLSFKMTKLVLRKYSWISWHYVKWTYVSLYIWPFQERKKYLVVMSKEQKYSNVLWLLSSLLQLSHMIMACHLLL